jgi:hypothetical protein
MVTPAVTGLLFADGATTPAIRLVSQPSYRISWKGELVTPGTDAVEVNPATIRSFQESIRRSMAEQLAAAVGTPAGVISGATSGATSGMATSWQSFPSLTFRTRTEWLDVTTSADAAPRWVRGLSMAATATGLLAWGGIIPGDWMGQSPIPAAPGSRLRAVVRRRHAGAAAGARRALPRPADVREERARETLRRYVGEDRYRRFVRSGFVTVRARSGRVYQLYPGYQLTRVWERGRCVERLCVVLAGWFPPTDLLLMRFLLLLNDEREFCRLANRSPAGPADPRAGVDERPLTAIYEELKATPGLSARCA